MSQPVSPSRARELSRVGPTRHHHPFKMKILAQRPIASAVA
jgi:hypothetical protein